MLLITYRNEAARKRAKMRHVVEGYKREVARLTNDFHEGRINDRQFYALAIIRAREVLDKLRRRFTVLESHGFHTDYVVNLIVEMDGALDTLIERNDALGE